jgi:hypothetical protein
MTLTDEQIERWSRQILLPEVGGRGQLRLLAARAAVLGNAPVAAWTVDLLRRAGVTTEAGIDDADLLVDLEGGGTVLARHALARGVPLVRGHLGASGGTIDTLVGRPCGLCASGDAQPRGSAHDALAAAVTQALAALVAAEVLRVLLLGADGGCRQHIDLDGGRFAGEPLATAGCEACGARP